MPYKAYEGDGCIGLSGGCAVMGGMPVLWFEAAEDEGGWAEMGVWGLLLVFWPYDGAYCDALPFSGGSVWRWLCGAWYCGARG